MSVVSIKSSAISAIQSTFVIQQQWQFGVHIFLTQKMAQSL